MRKFWVTFAAEVSVSDAVIKKASTKAWQKQMFPVSGPESIAEHIAYNMVKNGLALTAIDGFADRKDSEASLDDLMVSSTEEDEP
jgi:hypothetical protein